MQKGVYLQVRQVGRPHERGQIVDQDVVDIRFAAASRQWRRLHPFGREGRRVLLIEVLARDAIRVSLQGHRAVLQMRQQVGRDSSR